MLHFKLELAKYFSEILPQILREAQEDKQAITFFILDIDYFKNYNDYYGHQAGDTALKRVSKALQELVQTDGDLLFRIGGEEFAGIIHTKNKDEAEDTVQSINHYIQTLAIEHLASGLESKVLTVSIGVCHNNPDDGKDMNYFYKQADKALYKAKDSGRNKTILCS